MNLTFRRLIILILISSTLLLMPIAGFSAEAQKMTLSEWINVAGRQRMLTQRVVKLYAQMLLDLEYKESEKLMESAITLYDKQLKDLETQFADNEEVAASLRHERTAWEPLKSAVSKRPIKKARIGEIARLDEAALKASHQVVLELESQSPTKAGYLVNLAGRQRMLSQRIAKFYMFSALGHTDKATALGLETAAKEFRIAKDELTKAITTTPEILQALASVNREWSVFEAAFDLSKGEFAPFIIARYSEKLLKTSNEITGMFAALPNTNPDNPLTPR